jgi:type I site-specific deoxyribonuclease, hsdR family
VRIDREVDGKIESTDQKHIMRYQQLFASLAVRQRLNEGVTSGVIWHTQGSGKTALSYYLNNVLTDYYAAHNKVAKFYFIVDRLDLLEQASQEFEARGLEVKTANSRVELMEQFRTKQSLEGDSGRREVTVVNIQRFDEDKTKIDASAYATNLQRVFIIDEAHRGYNPKGSFLANMLESDPNSVKIALTGTPLLKDERASWKVFGDYLHTYYYDKSIQDGYTLKIIREDIETAYRDKLSEIYDSLDHLVLKKEVSKKEIIEHEHYVKELLRYVITDFKRFRTINGDDSLGGMVICETSQQARNLAAYFDEVQAELNTTSSNPSKLRAGLILFDSDDKDTQKQIIKDFKKNYTVDILIVFNMLLTGFDAPRLKRLYLGRKLKDHNLLQALTRVNRPYKDHRYGYVVDFADIKQNFDETNAAYLKELNKFNDPEETGEDGRAAIEQVIEDPAALVAQVREARNILFTYNLDNAEEFSRQIAGIDEKETLVELRKALQSIREGINLARTFGDDDLKAAMERMNIEKLPSLLSEVENAIGILNQKEAFTSTDETRRVINEAMLDIEFKFRLKNEEELNILAGAGDKFRVKWRRAICEFTANIDQEDPEFVTLRDAFMHRFKERGFVIDSMSAFYEEDRALDQVMDRLIEIKQRNNALLRRYNGDPKFVRVHKRVREESEQRRRSGQPPMGFEYDEELVDLLTIVKKEIDYKIFERADILKTDGYFSQVVMQTLALGLAELNLNGTRADKTFMQERITRQYRDQYTGAHTIAR